MGEFCFKNYVDKALSQKFRSLMFKGEPTNILFSFIGNENYFFDSWASQVYLLIKNSISVEKLFENSKFRRKYIFQKIGSTQVDKIKSAINSARERYNCGQVIVFDASIVKGEALGQLIIKDKGLAVKCGFLLENCDKNVKNCEFFNKKINSSLVGDASISCVVGDRSGNLINAFQVKSAASKASKLVIDFLKNSAV